MKYLKITVILLTLKLCEASYDGQPRIISLNGNLIIESAKDRNITFKLIGNGHILANNVDLISGVSVIQTPYIVETSNGVARPTQNPLGRQQFSLILNKLELNLTQLVNITRSQGFQIRRLQMRLSRTFNRIQGLITDLSVNECTNNVCAHGGTCIPMYKSFVCMCTKEWQGERCDTDVDECAMFANTPNLGCQNGAICQNNPGGYTCQCSGGFYGVHCTERQLDCMKSSARELCDHGTCVNTRSSIECICEQGWKKNERTGACSIDINECEANVNPCHSMCINLPGTFLCGPCSNGFTGNGFVCKDIDECQTNHGGCSAHAKCINTIGSFHCGACATGYEGDGHTCSLSESNACLANNPCHLFASCRMASGVAVCTCNRGYTGNGFNCRPISNPCASNPCPDNQRCVRNGTNDYSCTSYAATPCAPNPCRNGGTCVGTRTSFECRCESGFRGRLCTTVDNHNCNKYLTTPSGTLNLMNYVPNSNCFFIIQTNDSQVLNITIDQFNIRNTTNCSKNFVQLHNGKNSAAPGIGRFCGDKLPMGGQLYTSHNYLYIWFKTDNTPSDPSYGFQLSWQAIRPICGGRYVIRDVLKSSGIISSPGWPNLSPPNRDCSWSLVAPFGKRWAYRILQINLAGTEAECNDYLEIMGSSDERKKFCSTTIDPIMMETTGNLGEINFHSDQFGSDSSFQLHYEVIDGIADCGGSFQDNNGIIKSPTSTNPSGKRITCQYVITQPIGTRVAIDFDVFELPGLFNSSSRSCSTASVEIYDGPNTDAPLLLRRCSSAELDTIKSTGNIISVQYKYYDGFSMAFYRGFKARYSILCDFVFQNDDPRREIISPDYPKPYRDGLDCSYVIQAPLHQIVSLKVIEFDLSNRKDVDCDTVMDNVQIYSNFDNFTRYCQSPGELILSQRNYAKIAFHSVNNFDKRRGFKFTYQFENIGCGGLLTAPNGTISTLNTRMTDRVCEWILKAPEGRSIVLDFKTINYPQISGSNCSSGLYQYENYTLVEPVETVICERSSMKTIVSLASAVTLIQKIRAPLNADEGFEVDYKYSESVCGGVIYAAYGEIKSPGFPMQYKSNTECVWVIIAPETHQIELRLQNFSLEQIQENCKEDYLEIRNGRSDQSPLIGRFCGQTIPSRIPSQFNFLYLKFYTDSSIVESGFRLLFERTATGCGGNIDFYEGSIHSPHYPDITETGALCNWLISVSAGSKITATITMVATTSEHCSKNKLIIFDGDSVKERQMAVNCSVQGVMDIKSQIITSSGNRMFVRFETGAQEGAKFLLDYKTNCQTVLNDLKGQIESPNFPDKYPNYLKCEWLIRVSKSKSITLIVSHLELEQSSNECYHDRLRVQEQKNGVMVKEHSLCVLTQPKTIVTEGDELKVIFTTDLSNGERGFRMEYYAETCGGQLVANRGRFESMKSPYSNDMVCQWQIEADYGSVVTLNVEKIFGLENCDWINEGVIISNDKAGNDTIAKPCSSNKMFLTSSGRSMYITFVTNAVRKQKYFKGSYSIKKSACGGMLQIDRSEIHIKSPNYPFNYPPDTDCTWFVASVFHKRFQLDLQSIDLEQSDDCRKDYLDLYDDVSITPASRTMQFCGDQPPKQLVYNSTKLVMVVRFHSDNETEKTGFDIVARRVCGATIDNVLHGMLEKHEDETDCVWNLKSKNQSPMTLIFRRLICLCDKDDDETACEQTRGVQVYEGSVLRFAFCKHVPQYARSTSDTIKIVVPDSVKYLKALYNVRENFCGGFLQSLRGTFTSPQYPDAYPANLECSTTIVAPKGGMIQINFLAFDVVESEHCNNDYLEIRQGNSYGKLIAVMCGSNIVKNTFKIYEAVWMKFRTVADSPGAKGFMASYARKLNVEVSTDDVGLNGTINEPQIYAEISDPFSWRIVSEVGKSIVFEFKEYSSGLKFYDGYDESADAIELQHSPFTIISTSNFAYLISDNDHLQHFRIDWRAIDRSDVPKNVTKCGEIIETTSREDRNFSSSNYPQEYDVNIDCEWIFKPKSSVEHSELAIYAVDLEVIANCDADYLKVYSGEDLNIWNLEATLCNLTFNQMPHMVLKGRPNLRLVFHSDSYLGGPGFTTKVISKCGGYLTEPSGVIEDNVMGDTQTCAWKIRVQRGKKIDFQFEFNPSYPYGKDDQTCKEAYAIIRDGIDEDAPIISDRICTQGQDTKIISRTNVAYVQYVAKKKIDWRLKYQEHNECDGVVHLSSAVNSTKIYSPNFSGIPHPYSECTWRFTSPAATTMIVKFSEFKIHTPLYICHSEFVRVRDGSTSLANEIKKVCTPDSARNLLQSTGNHLWLQYFANVSEPNVTFAASVSIAKCFLLADGYYVGSIKSLNYPAKGGYKPHSECVFELKQSNMLNINLTINDIHLPFDASNLNRSDHLEITMNDGKDEQVIYLYGNETRKYIELYGAVGLKFVTFDATTQYRGFSLQYKRYNTCFKTIFASEGELTRRKGNRSYPNCRWLITVPKGRVVRAQIVEMQVATTYSRATPKIRFYNDHGNRSTITEVRNFTTDSINSTDNRMTIRIYGGFPVSLLLLRIKFDSYEPTKCLGNVNISVGEEQEFALSDATFNRSYFCTSNIINKWETTTGIRIKSLVLPTAQKPGFGESVFVRFKYNHYMVLHTNLSNWDIPVAEEDVYMEMTNSGPYSIFDLQMVAKKNPCGHANVYDVDQVKMPNLTNYGRIDCAWTFKLGDISMQQIFNISVNFKDSDCSREYLAVYGGRSPSSIMVRKLCKNEMFVHKPMEMFMLLHYHSDEYNAASRLNVTKQNSFVCGGEVKPLVRRGAFIRMSTADYKENMECIWTYTAADGFSAAIVFSGRMFIPSNPNCTEDYLQIRGLSFDNTWINYPRICGREIPPMINATNTQYEIKFRSDGRTQGDGFELTFQDICGGVYNATHDIKTIRNPNEWYTTRYNMKCNYTIVTDSKKIITLNFKRFAIGVADASNQKCTYAKMSVYYDYEWNERKINEYCGSNKPYLLKSKNYITIVYESRINGDQFEFEFYLDDCGGTIKEPTRISSPKDGSGKKYPGNMYCQWNIEAPADKDIAIRFNYLIYENLYKCKDDFVAVYNASEVDITHRKLLICGNHTGFDIPVVKTSSRAVIVTKSDMLASFDGFSADVSFVQKCDKFLNLTDGKYTHNEIDYYHEGGRYDNNLDCHIYFATEPAYQIAITFMDMDLTNCSRAPTSNASTSNASPSKCACDYLEIFDSPTIYQRSLGRFCGKDLPLTVQSSKEFLTLRFVTDREGGGSGFKYEVKRVPNVCSDGTINLEDLKEHTLTSPNYPNYPPNMYCEWTIVTNDSFIIQFDTFELESELNETGLCNDYLEIVRPFTTYSYDRDLVFCSDKRPTSIKVDVYQYTSQMPKIIFRSNSQIEKKGFKLMLKETGICNLTYNELSGEVKHPIKENCRFNIEIEEPKTLALYFAIQMFNFGAKTNCSQRIEIFNINTTDRLHAICLKDVYSSNYPVFLKQSKVTVSLTNPSPGDHHFDLNLFYMGNTNGLGCGGEIRGTKGFLSSPMYPNNFRNYTECRWTITVPSMSIISIFYHDFDMGSKKNCENYLQYYDVLPSHNKLSRQYCGGDYPFNYASSTNKMVIVYKRTVNFDGRGWMLNFDATSKPSQGNIETYW